MNIAAGLSSLKAATDLTRALRDSLKSGQIKGDDIAGRIGEIYDYIVDSKDALVEAKDELSDLKEKLRLLENNRHFHDSLVFHDGVYKRTGLRGEEIYCAACYDETGKRIRVAPYKNQYSCPVKHGYIG